MLKWLKTANPSLAPSSTNVNTPGLPKPLETENPRMTVPANREVEKVIAESLAPSTTPGLPKPLETDNPRMTAAANREVEKVIAESSGSRKRKRGNYGNYSPEMRAKVAKLCLDIGASKAARQLSKETGRQINESTVRSIKKSYVKEKQRLCTDNVENLPRRNLGRPLKLGDLDGQVGDYIRNRRKAGGVVNRLVVMAAARGFVAEHGGNVDITTAWANSFLRRMDFDKETKAARKVSQDELDQTKAAVP